MANIQQKCNELIKLAADISLLSNNDYNVNNVNNDDNIVHSGLTKLQINIDDDTHYSKYHGKIPIDFKDNYDCGELFIKVMGDTDHKGKYKWYSVIESKDNYFNLRGEIQFPLKIYDINIDMNGIIKNIINFGDIKWNDNNAPSMLLEDMDDLENDMDEEENEMDDEENDDDKNEMDEEHNSDEEEETSDSDEPYDENNVSEEELIIKKDGIHVSIA